MGNLPYTGCQAGGVPEGTSSRWPLWHGPWGGHWAPGTAGVGAHMWEQIKTFSVPPAKGSGDVTSGPTWRERLPLGADGERCATLFRARTLASSGTQSSIISPRRRNLVWRAASARCPHSHPRHNNSEPPRHTPRWHLVGHPGWWGGARPRAYTSPSPPRRGTASSACKRCVAAIQTHLPPRPTCTH